MRFVVIMAAHLPPVAVTVEELAENAGLPVQCLYKEFHEEHAHVLAEFCYPWENIGYHLKLTGCDISDIKEDNADTKNKRIATLKKWKKKFAHKATYQVLIEAMILSEHCQQALNLCRKLKHVMPAADQRIESNEGTGCVLSRSNDTSLQLLAEQNTTEDIPHVDVKQSIHQLQTRFICIQNRFLQQSGAGGTGVTLEQLKICISTLPSFTTDTPQLLLEASSIAFFAFNLKRYCCALNPDILEGLIEELGDDDTRSMMKKYNADLHEFQYKTKLKDFVGNYDGPTPPEYKEVQVKLGDNWLEKTLADVKLLSSQISRQSWLVKMVSINSIYVTFMIPQVDHLDLGVHLKDYLRTQCVLQILVGGECIFNCEGMCIIW